MKNVRKWVLLAAAVAALAAAAFLARMDFVGRSGTAPPVEAEDRVQRCHAVLLRIDWDYAERMASMRRLREAQLARGQGSSPEDEVVSAAQRLLREATTAELAAKAARVRVAGKVNEVAVAAGRVGILLGPRMTPELLQAKIKDEEGCRRFASHVYELQHRVCVQKVLARAAEGTSAKDEPQPAAQETPK